jgi:alpha-amylase
MYQFVSKLNKARKAAAAASSSFYTTQMNITQMGANEVLIVKGPLVSLLSNRGQGQASGDMTIPATATGWKSGQTVVDTVSCNTFTTGGNGDLTMAIENGMPRVLLLDSQKGNVCDATSSGSSTPQGAANSRFALDALTLSAGVVGAGVVGLALL